MNIVIPQTYRFQNYWSRSFARLYQHHFDQLVWSWRTHMLNGSYFVSSYRWPDSAGPPADIFEYSSVNKRFGNDNFRLCPLYNFDITTCVGVRIGAYMKKILGCIVCQANSRMHANTNVCILYFKYNIIGAKNNVQPNHHRVCYLWLLFFIIIFYINLSIHSLITNRP